MPRRAKGQQAPYHVRKTTLLPSSLREELVASGKLAGSGSANSGGITKSTSVIGRKQRRQQERKQGKNQSQSQNQSRQNGVQKEVKASQPEKVVTSSSKGKQRAQDSDENTANDPGKSKKRKRVSFGEPEQDDKNTYVQKRKISSEQSTPLQRLLERTEASGSGAGTSSGSKGIAVPSGPRTAREQQEDEEIAWLEAKLGIRKNPNARKEMQEDGLDDLFDDLDKLEEDIFGEGNSEEDEESEPEDDDDEEENDFDDGEESSVDEDQLESEIEDLAELDTEDEEDDNDDVDDQMEVGSDMDKTTLDQGERTGADSLAESTASSAPAKYIPPSLRKAAAAEIAAGTDPVEDPRLRRLLMGLLNRLSPTSFPTLVVNPSDPNSLHSIYMSNSRGSVNSLIVTLILEIVSAQGEGIGDTQIVVLTALVKVLSTGLIGGMNASGGKETAASLVDGIIKRLDKAGESDDKERLNLVGFLAQLYNFQVVAAGLIYELIREFIQNGLLEKDVESLLRIMKVSGPQLRHDDPSALKQIIQLVQDAQKSIAPDAMSSRTMFMIETLANLKNNKIKPASGVAAEAEASLKKYISNLSKKSGASEPLRVSLADLRSSSTKGKWWLVGAAWSGNPLVDKQAEIAAVSASAEREAAASGKEAQLLKLARKQGMNTDVRRRIFVALMSGEDYVDATSRLNALGLTEVQQREIIRVLLHCLGNEKTYNPYYTLIVARLLTSSSTSNTHSYQITLQYSLWDFFRALGESEVGGAEMVKSGFGSSAEGVSSRRTRNMAKAYAWWCAKSGLGLNIFKPLPFPTLQADSRAFLAQFFTAFIRSTQSTSPLLTTFPKQLDSTVLQQPLLALASSHPRVAQGMAWFLQQKEMRKEKDELVKWGRETALEALQTVMHFD